MSQSIARHRLARRAIPAAVAVLAAVLFSGGVRAADVFYNATFDLGISEDSRLFLNLTNQRYAPPQPVAVQVVSRCQDPADDFPVVMMLASASGRDPMSILQMRLEGRSWSAIFTRVNVSHDILFTGMDHDPGPPYGRAWGHYKGYKGAKKKFALPDEQVVALAKLQTVSSYYHVSPYQVTSAMTKGHSVESYAAARSRPAGAAPVKQEQAQKNGRPAHAHQSPQHHKNKGAHSSQGGGPDNHH